MKRLPIAFLILILLLTYLYLGTGIHSDDYSLMDGCSNWTLGQLLTIDVYNHPTYWFCMPVMYYDYIQFYLIGHNTTFYDLIKIFTSFGCIFLISLFARDYMHRYKALLFSTIFILFPTHDATNFHTTAQYMIITAALVMYTHYLINKNKLKRGFLFGILASFSSYASPPYFFGLSLIFLLRKQYNKFVLFLLPQFIYIAYYVVMKRIIGLSDYRTGDILNVSKILKQYILQIATFIDAALGPSFWLKIYYSFTQLSPFSILIGGVVVYMFYRYYELTKERVNIELLCGFISVLFFAFGLYALTGYNPQLAFNIGNRTTIFGSLLMSFMIVMFLMNGKRSSTLLFAIFLFSVLGISDHWKNWNSKQQTIIQNIAENRDLEQFDKTKWFFVSHNQYSQFGKVCHIEFFPDVSQVKAIFKYATGRNYNVTPINKRFFYENDKIVDKKYGSEFEVGDSIYVYDSNSDVLERVELGDIKGYIKGLPDDKRHWIQLLDKDNWIRRLALYLMPRLDYVL